MMKVLKLKLLLVCALALLLGVAPLALGDWDEGDGHKMHYPQLPKPGGWDVSFQFGRLADDWQCSQTGPVEDIHFWVSWEMDMVGPITGFSVRIHSNIPADESPTGYSIPAGDFLFERDFGPDDFTVRDMPDDLQGWFDPWTGFWIYPDHGIWQQINIEDINDPFIQQQGEIYWLEIDMWGADFCGWKESGSPQFCDDAVFWDFPNWLELRDPETSESLDLAFVITGREEEVVKWEQPPCLDDPMLCMDVDATDDDWMTSAPQALADDFLCTTTGLITDIHIWGSWLYDYPPFENPEHVWFTLCLYSNDPCGPMGWSEPNELLWMKEFHRGEFDVEIFAEGPEAYYIPCEELYMPDSDWTCWLYSFYIDPYEAFVQEEGTIYWLAVQAHFYEMTEGSRFGWKNSSEQWNDDAVWAVGKLPDISPWVELIHPMTEESMDLAFKITTKPLKRPVPHLKWSQPPIEIDPTAPRKPVYSGWDEPSWARLQVEPPFDFCPPQVADDFRCLGSMPIKSIHWWGSHYGWEYEEPGVPPPHQPMAWNIGFWSNAPANPTADPCYSHPEALLWWIEVDADRVEVEEVGTDSYHGYYPQDICYQYTLYLKPEEVFWQGDYNAATQDDVFWLSIQAVYPQGTEPVYPWGWKTRPWSWMDDAVRREVRWVDPLPECIWVPIKDPLYGESMDVAFELDTDPNWIKWEQAYDSIRHWPHYEDELSMATVETIVEPITKWIQQPDTSPNGIDVDATDDIWRPQLLADDFQCELDGPIDRIHVWGSWYHDYIPYGDPCAVTFTLSIHEDLPIGHPENPNPWSMPGRLLWTKTFYPGDFDAFEYEWLEEGWFVPCAEPPYYDAYADNVCWLYMFPIDPMEAFWQEQGKIYWLDVQAQPLHEPGYPEPIRFGWKNTPEWYHWNDDAVWAVGTEQNHGPWNEMRYPDGHPLAGMTVDLAFEIFTYGMTKWSQPPDMDSFTSIDIDATKDEIWNPQVLADDFNCVSTEPVTDIHIWGSWYHDFVPDPMTLAFTLSIHKDIPADESPTGYSMPGDELWRRDFWPGEFDVSIEAENLEEGYYVPCAEPPYYEPFGDSICWKYDFYINESEAFVQEGDPCNPVIYWLAVQARIAPPAPGIPIEPIRGRFGWKTSTEQWNDDAVWAISYEGQHGPWQELRHPETGKSLDLAFEITSEEEHEEFVIHRLVADDWACDQNTPVTAAVWWGSYLDYTFQPCSGEFMPLPVKPDYFLLNIWTDVPAGPDVPFSHPNEIIWEYKAYDYDEVLVGYDKNPHDDGMTGPPREPVFRYSVRIEDPNDWFCQDANNNSVYWFSVVAVYDDSRSNYDWGWTNHEHMFNDNAVEGYPTAAAPDEWVWNPLYDQTRVTEDMSFILFTQPCFHPGMVDACGQVVTPAEYNRWVSLGKPESWCYPCHCRGDINDDCFIDAFDLQGIDGQGGVLEGWVDAWFEAYDPDCDVNYDGFIDAFDLQGPDGQGGTIISWVDGWFSGGCAGVPGCP